MTVHEVADLLFSARERLDYYWNFHVVVVVAAIGWLVSLKKALTPAMKVLVSVVYVLAAVANLAGLWSSYAFAEALRVDLLRLAADTPLAETRLLLARHSYLTHRAAAVWIHLAIAATLLFVVWFARPFEPPAAPAKEPDEA